MSKNYDSMEEVGRYVCHGGTQLFLKHQSSSNKASMSLAVFLPSQATQQQPVPLLVFLSGLTCSEKNFTEKAAAQQHAERLGVALVIPDTSARVAEIGEEYKGDSWDIGEAAAFYLDATEEPWRAHFQMETYVTQELLQLVRQQFPQVDCSRVSLAGHSMGGHGALSLYLRHPELFRCASAFAPILSPSRVPWGTKAFTTYLGSVEAGAEHDSELLVAKATQPGHILIDQGTADSFLQEQLPSEHFLRAAEGSPVDVRFNLREGYDHSYYFVQSFIGQHLEWHAEHLKK